MNQAMIIKLKKLERRANVDASGLAHLTDEQLHGLIVREIEALIEVNGGISEALDELIRHQAASYPMQGAFDMPIDRLWPLVRHDMLAYGQRSHWFRKESSWRYGHVWLEGDGS